MSLQYKKGYVFMVFLVMLTACGFHLKGYNPDSLRPLPFKSLYINGQASLIGQLSTSLEYDDRIKIVATPQNADAILTIFNEKMEKEVLTINTAGRTDQYRLIYRVNAKLTVHGVPYEPEIVIAVTRSMDYSNSVVLGKQLEEAMLWEDMRKDAVDQIIRRLSYLKPMVLPEPSSESSKTK